MTELSSRNLLDSADEGTFMSITLGAATKLLDDMMTNYSEWHTERAPQGKKVNSVEETSSLSDKIDTIMSMLVNGKSHIDPNNVVVTVISHILLIVVVVILMVDLMLIQIMFL